MSNTRRQDGVIITFPVSQMSGRQVLQPSCNRVPSLQRLGSLKKITPVLPPKHVASPLPSSTSSDSKTARLPSLTPPTSLGALASRSSPIPKDLVPCDPKSAPRRSLLKSKSFSARVSPILNIAEYNSALSLSTSLILESPKCKQEERKSRIAHYGRVPRPNSSSVQSVAAPMQQQATQVEKRCTFITPNSDPIFVAYHDEEWGVPVHDDRLLFELLVLTGAQVGSDWTTVLKRRQSFKEAFAGFDAEVVAKFPEKQMLAISFTCGLDYNKIRGVVDNASRILEVTRDFGSLDKYFWSFVNHNPITTNYKTTLKIPVKTSKSESISKDMVKRGFRSAGPTVIHSFTQAAGLTNDHLISCSQHAKCAAMA